MADSENLNLIRTRLKALISPYHDVPDEDLSLILYERHDLFNNFIQWALSKMDDELGEYFRKSQNLQRGMYNCFDWSLQLAFCLCFIAVCGLYCCILCLYHSTYKCSSLKVGLLIEQKYFNI